MVSLQLNAAQLHDGNVLVYSCGGLYLIKPPATPWLSYIYMHPDHADRKEVVCVALQALKATPKHETQACVT